MMQDVREFGENKVQELVDKYDAMPKGIHWHMIRHSTTKQSQIYHWQSSIDSFCRFLATCRDN